MDRGESPKVVFRRLRNYLAGRHVGATRDATLMHEVLKCVFCHVFADAVERPIGLTQNSDRFAVAIEYRKAFTALRQRLSNLFGANEELLLDPASIAHVHNELWNIDFANPMADPIGDLYEAFVGTAIQKNEGQFFTPQVAVEWLVGAVDPVAGERIIDPACGAGGFLSYTARKLIKEGRKPSRVASSIFGVDKDAYLTRLANLHIALSTFSDSRVICADSLSQMDTSGQDIPADYRSEFDVVLTNPPFGAQIVAGDEHLRRRFELAHRWRCVDQANGKYQRTEILQPQTPPQVLFVERCVSLLKPGGRLGLVVPESLVTSASYGYVVHYLKEHTHLRAVVGMPESLFKTSGKGGTHTKTALVVAEKRGRKRQLSTQIFLAEAKWCGNDSRGREIEKNDLPTILTTFKAGKALSTSNVGYWRPLDSLAGQSLSPRYHDPEADAALSELKSSHDLVTVQELVDRGALEIRSGDEVGKLAYGTGEVPFVRTSDISNWEIKLDPKHGVSVEIYEKYRHKQDVREGDVLMVRDGTYLVGSCAYVSAFDEKIVYQSHLLKLRCVDYNQINPFLLLALLSSDPVLKQIKAKRVTQDIIDSIGSRVFELSLPVPKSKAVREEISALVERAINERILAREHARFAKQAVLVKSAAQLKKLFGGSGLTHAVSDNAAGGRQ